MIWSRSKRLASPFPFPPARNRALRLREARRHAEHPRVRVQCRARPPHARVHARPLVSTLRPVVPIEVPCVRLAPHPAHLLRAHATSRRNHAKPVVIPCAPSLTTPESESLLTRTSSRSDGAFRSR